LKSLKCNDHDNDGKLSCKEFIKALHEIRIELLEKETISVFSNFDPRHTSFIHIDEFMEKFVPPLATGRVSIINELNNKIVTNKCVSFNKIHNLYNARGHPDFKSGIKPDYVIKEEFFEILNIWLHLTTGIKDEISLESWNKFIEMWSYGYEDDQFFDLMTRGVFKLSNYYGSLSVSKCNDQSISRNEENNNSYQTRPQTSQSSKINYPFATDGVYNCNAADMQRPRSVAYSSKGDQNATNHNIITGQPKYNPVTNQPSIGYNNQQHNENNIADNNFPAENPQNINIHQELLKENEFDIQKVKQLCV